MQNKSRMTLMPVEAYAMKSQSYLPNDTHVFVINLDRSMQWTNAGGGWTDSRPKTLVANTSAYKEWLVNFMRPGYQNPQGGISFGLNGICHTYANRELAVANTNADARLAAGDQHAVFFFGKYGLGLGEFKKLLTDAYNLTLKTYDDPYNALQIVLNRVDNYINDELLAWKYIAETEGGMNVDAIIARNPVGGIATARQRLQNYINERETIYTRYLRGELARDRVQPEIKAAIIRHVTDYLNMLCSIQYISVNEKNSYITRLNTFLNHFIRGVQRQRLELQAGNLL